MNELGYCTLLVLLATGPLVAQAPSDDVASSGFSADFNNQDIRVVLSAVAEAAGVNVVFGRLPPAMVTLRMARPIPKEQLLDLIRSIAQQNHLSMRIEGSLIRIERASRGQSTQVEVSQPPVEFYAYRVKHAKAADIGPILMNLFTGAPLPSQVGGPTPDGQNPGGPGGIGGPVSRDPGSIARAIRALADSGAGGGRIIRLDQMAGGDSAFSQAINDLANAGPGGGRMSKLQRMFGVDGSEGSIAEMRIVAEESTNSLLIRTTAEGWDLVQKVMQEIDIRPLQVLIEAVIVEVTRTTDLNVGVDATVTNAYHGQSQKADLPSTPNARDFLLQLVGSGGNVDVTAALNALASRGELRVRSLPVIIGQNNIQAVLNVGSSRPFVAMSQTVPNDPTNQVRNTQYIDVGTKLQITPRINADGYVNLVVAQTANTASNEIQFDAPVINKREATTQVFLRDGQTTVLGGLADHTVDYSRTGIPVLRWLPVIGGLFGSTHKNDVQTELYVFLTPHIITGDADIDRLRDSLQRQSKELQKAPVTPIFPSKPTVPSP